MTEDKNIENKKWVKHFKMLKYTELGRVEHDKLYFLMHGDLMCKRPTENVRMSYLRTIRNPLTR